MLPPVGRPGLSNPSGTTTWTRTMLRPSRAPAAPSQPPSCGRLNHTRRRSVIPDTAWHAETVDTVRPETIGVRSTRAAGQVARLDRVAPALRADSVRDVT